MTRFLRMLAVPALVLGLSCAALAEDRVEESGRLVETLVERIVAVFKDDPSPATIRAETNMVIDEFFDYDLIARFAAGNAWRGATDQEKADYKAAFRELLLSLAETHFERLRSLEYKPVDAIAKGDKLVIVSGLVRDLDGKLPDAAVNWRVRTRPGKPPRIIDLEVENISMLITQQQENTAIISQNGGSFRALIDSLKERAEAARKDAQAAQN